MIRPPDAAEPHFNQLSDFATALEAQYRARMPDWHGSPFSWITNCPPARRGSVGKQLISNLLENQEFLISPCRGRGADRIVNGSRMAMKFSMMWEGERYVFQQIRDENYDLMFCLGVCPHEAHAWVFAKDFLLENRGGLEGFTFQHRGQRGRDTAWIHVDPSNPQPWLRQHGGTLSEAIDRLAHLAA